MAIRRAIIIIPMGITGGRTTIIPSHIHLITVATDTLGIMGVEVTPVTIAIIVITTAIELKSISQLLE